ncbi:MAG: hypothetical protein GF409_02290, partial [Candidatus Omnitrophica bacterium]|nr:hypothetical protein [Candidatus Omnitrophota bacterium]
MNFNLFHYTLSYVLVGSILTVLSVFIFAKGKDNALFKTFALYNLAIAWWCIFSVPAILSYNLNIAAYWCRTFIVGAIFIPTLFLHFAYLLLGYLKRKKYIRILQFSYALSCFFLLANFTPLFIHSAEVKQTLRAYTVPGPLFHVHVFQFFITMFYGEVLFLRKYLYEKKKVEGRKYLYFFVTAFIATLGGGANYFPVYKLEYPIINPFGTYLIILYALTVTYIIFKYKFLNVAILIKRTIVFAGLFVASYLVMASIAYLGTTLFENFNHNRWITMVASVMIIVLMLRPLEHFLKNVTDKFLFQKKYDYKKLLRTFSDKVITVLNLEELVNLTVSNLVEIMKLENASILLRDEEMGEYHVVASSGLDEFTYYLEEQDHIIASMQSNEEYILLNGPNENQSYSDNI